MEGICASNGIIKQSVDTSECGGEIWTDPGLGGELFSGCHGCCTAAALCTAIKTSRPTVLQ